MDDTQPSRVSDAAAAATRKRRSSILKSQRPARTPFSELEFNVATPTDTAKSRRVSFSKRTGVAEFVTNEATTTWKNFYEEHNKSLESSSNDSEANASRQPVGHLGKRIFDQQFEEVDMDFMSGLVNGSLNNVNYSEQLASLECTEGKLTAPNNKFELSAFTEQSKLFGNDFTAPSLGENSGRIEVNFSAIQQVEKDDLDEIAKDLERSSNNMGCDGSFSDRQNMSEYIEVDLNMTHVVKNDEDMSITDTVHSPVQDVSKSVSIDKKATLNNDWVADKENIAINPYAAPCETNFAVNEEPEQVLVFDGKRLTLQPDKPEKDKSYSQTLLPNSSTANPQRKTIVLNVNDDLPNFLDDMLNSKCENSGFSGFQEIKSNEEEISDNLQLSKVQHKSKWKTINDNTGNMSMTRALPTNIIGNMSMTQALPANIIGNMSMTQALPANIIGNMSMTQALPANIIGNMSMTQALPANIIGNESMTQALPANIIGNMSMTQALPANIIGNMSMTQALPANIIGNESMTQALPANIIGNMSMTQALPANIIGNMSMTQALSTSIICQAADVAQDANLSKRRTIVFDKSNNDISVTATVPVQLLSSGGSMSDRRRTAIYEDDAGNISITQGVPSNILVNKNVDNAENDTENMSITQAIPAQLIPGYSEDKPVDILNTTKKSHTVYEDDTGHMSITEAMPAQLIPGYSENKPIDVLNTTKKSHTVVYKDDTGNMSITEAMPAQLIPGYSENKPIDVLNTTKKSHTVYEDDTGNMSITEAMPAQLIPGYSENKPIDVLNTTKKSHTVYEDDTGNMSITEAMPAQLIPGYSKNKPIDVLNTTKKSHTAVYEDDTGNMSITQAMPAQLIPGYNENKPIDVLNTTKKSHTAVYEDDTGNVSITQAIPAQLIPGYSENKPIDVLNTTKKSHTAVYKDDTGNMSITQAMPAQLIPEYSENKPIDVLNTTKISHTAVYEDDTGNISITQGVPSNILINENVDNAENDAGNMSITQAIPAELIPGYSEDKPIDVLNTTNKTKNRKRTTIVYDNDDGEISITETIPVNIIEEVRNERKTNVFDENEANISMTLAISTNVFLLDQLDSAVDVKQPKESTAAYVKNPEEPVQVLQDERKSNEDMNECEMSMTMEISKAPSLREIEKGDLSPLQDEQKFNEDMNECDMSMAMAISKAPSLREIEKGDLSVTKPIPAKLITFTEVSDKLKDKLLDLTEPDQIVSCQSDVIVLQSSKTNSKPSPQTNVSEKTGLKKIGDIYNEIFKDSSEIKEASAIFVANDVTRSPVGDDGSSASLIHPRVVEKINQLSLVSTDWRMENIAAGEDDAMMQTDAEAKQESLINTEMSMSVHTIDSGTDDKNLMTHLGSTSSPRSVQTKKSSDGNISDESMFYVTKDNEDDGHTDRETTKSKEVYKQLPHLQLEDNLEAVDVLKQKLAELQKAVSQNQSNRCYEKLDTPDLEEVDEFDDDDRKENSYKRADDTQELLNMLSNLTEPIASDSDIGPGAVKFMGSEIGEHKRLSFAPGRQSIVLSREDLLSNISMAQAALQKSRLALDDSHSPEDDTREASVDICDKTGTTSNDVVKTLNFNDESISEDSLKEFTPLKKTAFGETSYMHETKGKVIPTYLKDVSDGIKELMLDLVKPVNNDNLPFETGVIDKSADLPVVNSTHSTQIQANLTTSSQIDMDPAMYSNTASNTDVQMGTSNKNKARLVRSPVRFSDANEKWLNIHTPAEQPSSVLIFDHLNPLNNILLPPTNLTEAHKYNPIKSVETLCVLEPPHPPPAPPHTHSIGLHYNQSSRDDTLRDFEVQTVTTKKQKVLTRASVTQKELTIPITKRKVQEDTTGSQKSKMTPKSSVIKVMKEKRKEPKRNVQHNIKNVSNKSIALDQSVDAVLTKLKDGEVNTTIAMKLNNELLESSSSLTLVDDALDGQTSPDLPDQEFSNQRIRFSRSHLVNIEEQAAEIDNISEISAISLRDKYSSNFNATISKGKKRIYSPSTDKSRQNTSIKVTPKPMAKMQRISNSPKHLIRVPMERSSRKGSAHSMEPEKDESRSGHTSKTSIKKSPKPRTAKPGQNITVRQLIADGISFDTGCQNADDLQGNKILGILNTKENLSEFSPSSESFTSSKDLKSVTKDFLGTENKEQFSTQVGASQADWQPELVNSTSSSQCEAESGVNVVAKIDMLPFMGSHECEWESSSRADSWTFRLLHGRLRLTARLAHRLDNATRTRVRGDTPVLDITVEAVQQDKKNPVAILCVRFACETMRHMVGRTLRNKCLARDIPSLLRRCAAVVRVALRWGRAMHDAKLHLAYTIDTDGNVSLKVANVPLRSVWEVTMRIELALEDEHSVPTPSARDVRVLPIVSDVVVPDADVQYVLDHTPKDWGHVPKIIWRVFRLLKHKKRDDEVLLS